MRRHSLKPHREAPAKLGATMPNAPRWTVFAFLGVACLVLSAPALAQIPPGQQEIAAYRGLHAAAAKGDAAEIKRLAANGGSLDTRDGQGRTPLKVAAFHRHIPAARAQIEPDAGFNMPDDQTDTINTDAL